MWGARERFGRAAVSNVRCCILYVNICDAAAFARKASERQNLLMLIRRDGPWRRARDPLSRLLCMSIDYGGEQSCFLLHKRLLKGEGRTLKVVKLGALFKVFTSTLHASTKNRRVSRREQPPRQQATSREPCRKTTSVPPHPDAKSAINTISGGCCAWEETPCAWPKCRLSRKNGD